MLKIGVKHMKKGLLILLLVGILTGIVVGNFSLGVALGLPTGLTAKYQFTPNFALDFDLSTSLFLIVLGYSFNASAVLIFPEALTFHDQSIPLYGGLGIGVLGVAGFEMFGGNSFSIRMPLGANYLLYTDQGRIETFAEIVPTLIVTPLIIYTTTFRLGARYIF